MSSTQYVDVEGYLQTVEAEVDADNAQAIREFIDYCAAQGLSEIRQQRHAQSLKSLITNFAPPDFQLRGATKDELEKVIAALNRSDYAEETKHTMKSAVKKFYRVENGGTDHPEKVNFFTLTKKTTSSVSRDDLFTDEELKRLFRTFNSVRDRAFTMVLYEAAARPGELLSRNIGDFTSNAKGDFIHLEGSKNTPDRTNQLVRSGRVLREWLAQHPLGGELGDIDDTSAPLWVKMEQHACTRCGEIPHHHDDDVCEYTPDMADRLTYGGFQRRFKQACQRADIPESKQRPYNLRHTRLTEVATFMGYEQLNKFAGWVPGSDRAKVYVHLNNDDVNQAIRDEYGLGNGEDGQTQVDCPFCDTSNQADHSECRQCGRPLSFEQQARQEEKFDILERLQELDEKGVLEKLEQLESGD